MIIVSLYYFVYPSFRMVFPRCPFFLLTNLYCPGCGSQRCLSALLHGHIWTAVHQNVLTVVAIPIVLYRVYLIFSGKNTKQTIFATKQMPWMVLIVVISFFILRNIPVQPFSYLAPF